MPKLPDVGALGAPLTPRTQRGIDTVRNAGVAQRATQQAATQDANSAERMGQKVSGALETIADDAADREFKRLDTEFAKEIQKITYGDGKTPGYYAQKGENALQARADAEKRIAEARERLAGSASGLARAKFSQAAEIRVLRETESINRHTMAQREVANDLVSESAIAQARDDAAASWNNPTVVGQSLRLAADEVQDIGKRKGWAPAVVQQQIEAEQTKIHLAVINNALEVDPMAAEAYYQTNKANIDGTARAAIEKSLEAGVLRKQSQAETDRIYGMGLDEKDAMKEARAIKDPRLRDEVVARTQRRFAEDDRIRRANEREAKDSGWQHILTGGSTDDLPASTLAILDGTTISAMRTFEKKRASDGRGFADATKPEAYNRLHALFMDDKVAFAEYDISQEINNLDEGDYQYWLAQQRAVDKAGEKEAAKNVSYTLGDRVAKEYMNAAEIGYTSSASPGDAKKSQRVFSLIRRTVDEFHADGKKPTLDDIERRLDELFLTGDLGGGMWSRDRPLFEVLGTDDEGKFVLTETEDERNEIANVTGVPAEELTKIVKALTDRDKPVTIANIKRLWESVNGR